MKPFELHYTISNEDYHAVDLNQLAVSSSQLKDIVIDPDVFFQKYIQKSIPGPKGDALDIGNYVHTALLEGHKLGSEYTVYNKTRSGANWKAFKEKHEGKIILNTTGYKKAKTAIEGLKASPCCMAQLKNGVAECSLFIDIWVDVSMRKVYLFNKETKHYWELTIEGWNSIVKPEGFDGFISVRVKVRADYMKAGEVDEETGEIIYGSLSDIKTMGGNPRDFKKIKAKIRDSLYDLSAAMYVDCFNALALFKDYVPYKEFHWQFSTKDFPMALNYIATEKQLKVGRGKWRKAVIDLATATYYKWNVPEADIYVEPDHFEDMWLLDEKPAKLKAAPKKAREILQEESEIDLI